MIHKVERLVSIGKYRNYQAVGDVAFKKLTLIYADNGSGKTTLTTIIRSLTQNDPSLVRKRLSTNAITPQAAQIIQINGGINIFHTLGAGNWSNTFPDIEIFDINFVHDNIYSGFEFNENHKKQLHQFVIGAQGVVIQQAIEQNKSAKTTSRQEQASVESQIITDVGNNLSSDMLTGFISLNATQAVDIDNKITKAEACLVSANSNSVIQTLASLSQLSKIQLDIDFDTLVLDLETTTQTIQDEALQSVFNDHCIDLENNEIERPEAWLRTGFNYFSKKNVDANGSIISCPFCKQEVNDDLDIIKAYTLKFNDYFVALVLRLQNHLTNLQRINLDALLQAAGHVNTNNLFHINTWATHLTSNAQSPVYNLADIEVRLKAQLIELITIVQQKAQNPSAIVNTVTIAELKSTLQSINANIATYNHGVISYNNCITIFKSGIQTIVQAQNEVYRLKRNKKRFEPNIDTLCTQLKAEKQIIKTLETTYTKLIQQQDTAATTFFNSYKDRINHYLTDVFKTVFRIEDVVNIPPQGRATQSKIGYKLTIDGHDISFDLNQPNCAKDCLSEGDKSTIALAFFLSKLDIDAALNNKILIFDDPLSSFDSNRRLYTIQLIKDLLPNMKQIVVLSHNEFFLHLLSREIVAGDKKTLRITENFLTRSSSIEPLDLDKLVENDYFKHVKELEMFLVNSDIDKKDIVLGWMRNVLEAHLRFKFYRQTSHLAPNSRTFGNLITALDTGGVAFRDNVNRAAILTKLRLINGISCKPHHGEPLPDYGTLGANPNTMNVVELAHFVQDTLDLIDNKL